MLVLRLFATLAILLGLTSSASAQPRGEIRIRGVAVVGAGDILLSSLRPIRIARATRDKQFGYELTYRVPDHGKATFFWPRTAIQFSHHKTPYHYLPRLLSGRTVRYPSIITAASLPGVHRGILQIEAAYAEQADGAIAAAEGFGAVATAGMGTPVAAWRATATRATGTGAGRAVTSRGTSRAANLRARHAATRRAQQSSVSQASQASGKAAAGKAAAAATPLMKAEAPSSRVLARALEASGTPRPQGAAAHHIVAGNAPRAQAARNMLARHGVGINEAANGVFLPANAASPNLSGAAVHSSLHTRHYYETVNKLLSGARSRAQVLVRLALLRKKLLTGRL